MRANVALANSGATVLWSYCIDKVHPSKCRPVLFLFHHHLENETLIRDWLEISSSCISFYCLLQHKRLNGCFRVNRNVVWMSAGAAPTLTPEIRRDMRHEIISLKYLANYKILVSLVIVRTLKICIWIRRRDKPVDFRRSNWFSALVFLSWRLSLLILL